MENTTALGIEQLNPNQKSIDEMNLAGDKLAEAFELFGKMRELFVQSELLIKSAEENSIYKSEKCHYGMARRIEESYHYLGESIRYLDSCWSQPLLKRMIIESDKRKEFPCEIIEVATLDDSSLLVDESGLLAASNLTL